MAFSTHLPLCRRDPAHLPTPQGCWSPDLSLMPALSSAAIVYVAVVTQSDLLKLGCFLVTRGISSPDLWLHQDGKGIPVMTMQCCWSHFCLLGGPPLDYPSIMHIPNMPCSPDSYVRDIFWLVYFEQMSSYHSRGRGERGGTTSWLLQGAYEFQGLCGTREVKLLSQTWIKDMDYPQSHPCDFRVQQGSQCTFSLDHEPTRGPRCFRRTSRATLVIDEESVSRWSAVVGLPDGYWLGLK